MSSLIECMLHERPQLPADCANCIATALLNEFVIDRSSAIRRRSGNIRM